MVRHLSVRGVPAVAEAAGSNRTAEGRPPAGAPKSVATYAKRLFRIRQTQALGGLGRLDPKWLETSERISK